MNDKDIQADRILSQPTRLAVVGYLVSHDGEASFVSICQSLKIKHYGALSSHNSVLERAGYVVLRKTFVGRKVETRLILTESGKAAFARHRAALAEVLNIRKRAGMAA